MGTGLVGCVCVCGEGIEPGGPPGCLRGAISIFVALALFDLIWPHCKAIARPKRMPGNSHEVFSRFKISFPFKFLFEKKEGLNRCPREFISFSFLMGLRRYSI